MTQPAAADQLWFLDAFVTVRVPTSTGQDGLSVLEHWMPHGSSAPWHRHRTEDELFHILEGEYRLKIQDQEQRVGPGSIVLAPKGIPHTYRVESPQGGRCLTISGRGDFERFVRSVSHPAARRELPPPAGPPSAEAIAKLTAAAAKHGIEILGPPLQ